MSYQKLALTRLSSAFIQSARDKKQVDVGANLYIGGLDPDVDERILYDTFSAFGVLITAPKIMRDENGRSKGYGFISYDSFEASDAAIQAMDGQWLGGKYEFDTSAHSSR